jgi:hypothetical protein
MNSEPPAEHLLASLAALPEELQQAFGALTAAAARIPGPNDNFSPVEQCWHLADLEREGYAYRIRRLLDADEPQLPDFDGDRIAAERNYRDRDVQAGIAAFREARRDNLDLLRTLDGSQWSRGGSQDGVGRIVLADLPRMMAAHDASHRAEIEAWLRHAGSR